jgi:hypothetical protein
MFSVFDKDQRWRGYILIFLAVFILSPSAEGFVRILCDKEEGTDIRRMPGGCEVMITPSGIRGKVGSLDGVPSSADASHI